MKLHKVSIIIPLYNAEKYLMEAINSALNQTYPNIEIIIIDDGSKDESYSIAKKIQAGNIIVVQQTNKGASAARNHGLSLATGDYIQFLDADDLLSPNKIENQLKAIGHLPNYISVCSTIHFWNGDNLDNLVPSSYEDSFLKYKGTPAEFLINLWGGNTAYGSMISIHSWLTPKHIIEKSGIWNEELTYDDDGDFFARVVLNSQGIVYSEHAYCYYRKQKTKSLSDLDSLERFKSMLHSVLLKKEALFRKTNTYPAKLAIYKMLTGVALKCLPKYHNLYKIAISALPKIDPKNYQPSIGGPITQKLVSLFGWKTIRLVQYYLRLKE
ncbi:glycosyltransferase family 2 protein [Pedobacter frigiditerrae]|uniref:glycosyltransferase family 2 protein n=1 Tax=Pedobacter frigiditerrae TaxID=2530452 RepID=UPI00292FE3F6|nr:glycosyltransferase family 2 protein [Pedobacter frigiditerrae]